MGKLELMNELMKNKVDLLRQLSRSLEVERGYIQSLETDRIQDVMIEIEDFKTRVQSVDLQFLSEFNDLKKDIGVDSLDALVNNDTKEVISSIQGLITQVRTIEDNIELSEKVNKELRSKRGRVLPNKNIRKQAADAYKKFK